jgi:hypothetical protein
MQNYNAKAARRTQSLKVVDFGLINSLPIADDGKSAFVFPLAISALTMIPFLYYQQ